MAAWGSLWGQLRSQDAEISRLVQAGSGQGRPAPLRARLLRRPGRQGMHRWRADVFSFGDAARRHFPTDTALRA